MRLILNLSFGLMLLFLSSTSLAVSGDLRWQSYYDREGVLDDAATSMAVSGSTVFVAGTTQTTTGGYAFTVRAHNTANGTVLWQDNYDREGNLDDWVNGIAVNGTGVFVGGITTTFSGGYAFSVRAFER